MLKYFLQLIFNRGKFMNKVSNFLSNILKACIGIMIIVLTISSICFMKNIQFHELSIKLFFVPSNEFTKHFPIASYNNSSPFSSTPIIE